MIRNPNTRRVIVAWSCLAILSPGAVIADGTQAAAKAPAAKTTSAPKTMIPDVALSEQGELRGRLLNGNRLPLQKTTVLLVKNGKAVAKTETQADGRYTFEKVTPGSYQIEVEKQLATVRVWSGQAAPKSASTSLEMAYAPTQTVRAQLGFLDPVNTSLLILGVTGTVLGAVAVSEINDLEDKVDDLQSP